MTENVQARIGAAVRAAMQGAGVSQAKLGEFLGLPQSSISRRLSGELPFTAAELVGTADLLSVPITQLVAAESPASAS